MIRGQSKARHSSALHAFAAGETGQITRKKRLFSLLKLRLSFADLSLCSSPSAGSLPAGGTTCTDVHGKGFWIGVRRRHVPMLHGVVPQDQMASIVGVSLKSCLLGVHTCLQRYAHQLLGNAVREGCSNKVADVEEEFGRRR